MNKIESHSTPDTLAQRNDEANLRELTTAELDQIEGGWFILACALCFGIGMKLGKTYG